MRMFNDLAGILGLRPAGSDSGIVFVPSPRPTGKPLIFPYEFGALVSGAYEVVVSERRGQEYNS